MQVAPVAEATSPDVVASSCFEYWLQSSIIWQRQPKPCRLIAADKVVVSRLPGRAASCATQEACGRDDFKQLFSIDQHQSSSTEGSAAIAEAAIMASQKRPPGEVGSMQIGGAAGARAETETENRRP